MEENNKILYRIEIPSGNYGEYSTVFYLWMNEAEKELMLKASSTSANVRRNGACAAIFVTKANTV